MAPSGPMDRAFQCLIIAVKPTQSGDIDTSEFDPNQTRCGYFQRP